MNKLQRIIISLTAAYILTSCLPREVIESQGYKFDPYIPEDQISAIINDLSSLSKLNNNDVSEEMDNVFKLSKDYYGYPSSIALIKWLDDRINYVIKEMGESDLLTRVYVVSKYEHSDELPDLELTKDNKSKDNKSKNKPKAVTVMSNMGAALYLMGKMNYYVLGLKIGRNKVPVISPRMGIISIGEGLFMDRLQISPKKPNSYANSIGRLSTYFHEARHSDGNVKSLGYVHALCPVGHSYENLNACDRSINGPYMIGARFTTHAASACNECTEKEKTTLLARALDSYSRVIDTKVWNDEPEFIPGYDMRDIEKFKQLLKGYHKENSETD